MNNTTDEPISLNFQQESYLKRLSELLVYGDSILSTVGLGKTSLRWRKKLLFLLMGSVQSYSESILRLMSPPTIYDKASEVILRSLFETTINLGFIYTGNNQKNAYIFSNEIIRSSIKFAERHKKFMQDNPLWQRELKFGDVELPSDWDHYLIEWQKMICITEKKYGRRIPQLPGLRNRASEHDNFLRSENKLTFKKSLEANWINYYDYFSGLAHLLPNGLYNFFNTTNINHFRLEIDGKPESIERVIPVTYAIYYSVFKFFTQQFKVYDSSELRKFKKI